MFWRECNLHLLRYLFTVAGPSFLFVTSHCPSLLVIDLFILPCFLIQGSDKLHFCLYKGGRKIVTFHHVSRDDTLSIFTMFSPTITSFATASANAAAKINANAKLKAFRQIAQSRVSARRFEPNVAVPDDVWRDVLQMTLVSTFHFYYLLGLENACNLCTEHHLLTTLQTTLVVIILYYLEMHCYTTQTFMISNATNDRHHRQALTYNQLICYCSDAQNSKLLSPSMPCSDLEINIEQTMHPQ